MFIQKEFLLKKRGYKTLGQALIKERRSFQRKPCFISCLRTQLAPLEPWWELMGCWDRGSFPRTPPTSSSLPWAVLPGPHPAHNPRTLHPLVMLSVTELRQSPGRSLSCWPPKKQSTQAEEMCYSLICSWLNATLRTHYFILKHL